MKSASPDRLAEDVRVIAVVVAELEFRDVERHVLGADLVEGADNAALEDAAEAFNRVGVDRADNVLTLGVVNDAMRELFTERPVTAPCVSAKQAHSFRNCAAHESGESRSIDVLDNARHDFTLAFDGADDWCLAGTDAASSTAAAALVPMPVLRFAADESFIDFHD